MLTRPSETKRLATLRPILQSVASMQYRLVSGQLDLSSLQVVEYAAFDWNSCDVEVFILGSSHAVTINSTMGSVTELLTCVAPLMDHSQLICTLPVPCQLYQELPRHGINISSNITQENGLKTLPAIGADGCLMHTFPVVCTNSSPVTEVNWSMRDNSLIIQSLHTYPNEDLSIISNSCFVLENPRGARQ